MKKKKQCYSGIGGQAVLEGVMMRCGDRYAIAMRRPDGSLEIVKEEYKGFLQGSPLRKVPFVRGFIALIDSLILGLHCTNVSAEIYGEEESEEAETVAKKAVDDGEDKDVRTASETKEGKEEGDPEVKAGKTGEANGDGSGADKDSEKSKEDLETVLIMGAGIVIAVGLFILLPLGLTSLLGRVIKSPAALAIAEGVLRLMIFLGYVTGISMMKDIKRLYQYHGAEHKCINCVESGLPLTVENAAKSTRLHKRCGSSFLLFVMMISIILFFFVRVHNPLLKIVVRLLMIPVISGISFEIIRLAGQSDNPVINAISAPGLWLQKLTTREPDNDMLEVGIASVEAVFDWKAYQESLQQ